MTSDIEAQLSILDAIQENGRYTQRDLAGNTGLALSYINRILKDLVKNEWVNVKALNGKRFLYDLTPKGMSEKARLTLKYVLEAVDRYQEIRLRVMKLCERLKAEGKSRVVFCGVSKESEIVYLAALEADLDVLGIIDDEKGGSRWLKWRVKPLGMLKNIKCDHIIITDIMRFEPLAQALIAAGTDPKAITLCIGHRIKPTTIFQVVED